MRLSQAGARSASDRSSSKSCRLLGVLQHNDLGTWNVVSDDGDFVVVDWENVRQSALPLWDLLYFLGDAFVLLDGSHDPERLPMRIARLFAGEAPSSPLLFSWVRRAAERRASRSTRSARSRLSAGSATRFRPALTTWS